MEKVFGYPEFDSKGEKILTTYENEYKEMGMDIRVYRMKEGEERSFYKEEEEMAVLLLEGCITYNMEGGWRKRSAEKTYLPKAHGASMYAGDRRSGSKARRTRRYWSSVRKMTGNLTPVCMRRRMPPWKYSCQGKFGNTANRRVNTIFDHDIAPCSNMVLGEVLNDRGNWSGYLPHRHPQPEVYYFKFDRPEGFGASFVGDEVYKSVEGSFSAIPGGRLHPQSAAPGYQMYTCWMIHHLEGNPWLQTDRCEDDRYVWLHEAEF